MTDQNRFPIPGTTTISNQALNTTLDCIDDQRGEIDKLKEKLEIANTDCAHLEEQLHTVSEAYAEAYEAVQQSSRHMTTIHDLTIEVEKERDADKAEIFKLNLLLDLATQHAECLLKGLT
jgi:peptidoglycan hydrolase CwlO-like protein